MKCFFLFLLAGLLEIAGGYLVWLWLREKQSLGFGIAGFVFSAIYGLVPVFQPNHPSFGRVYAISSFPLFQFPLELDVLWLYNHRYEGRTLSS